MERLSGNWLSTYAEHTAISEAPRAFHFWTGVSVIAGALQRKVWIDQRLFQWTPNFYIVLVAPPGVATKSTTMRVGYRILKEVPGIYFGPQSMTWQGLLNAFTNATRGIDLDENAGEKTDFEQAMTERTTMSCITCDVSELGTFLKPKDAELVDFLIDMWDGQQGNWTRSLATKEDVTVSNPWLNIIGCTTPSWLQNNFSTNMIFGGLTSRCIFVWGHEKTNLIAYPADLIQDEEYQKREHILIHDLTTISKLRGEMQLTSEAKEWGRAWYQQHWTHRPEHLTSDRFSGYIARKQTHIHKLAMILSASASNDLVITEQMLELADMTVTSVERDLTVVFDSISDHDAVKHVDEILTIIRRNKTIRKQTWWRHVMRLMDEQQFDAAIKAGINAGYLSQTVVRGDVQLSVKKEEKEEI